MWPVYVSLHEFVSTNMQEIEFVSVCRDVFPRGGLLGARVRTDLNVERFSTGGGQGMINVRGKLLQRKKHKLASRRGVVSCSRVIILIKPDGGRTIRSAPCTMIISNADTGVRVLCRKLALRVSRCRQK